MAERIPLRLISVSGIPTIGEFQAGDVVSILHGGTGVSSLNELAGLLDEIPGGALSSLTDDVAIGSPFTDPVEGHALVWKGSNWQAGYQALSSLVDTTFTDLSTHQHISWDGTAWVNVYNDTTEMRVRNGTASAMSKGDVIAIDDAHNANLVNVILADASQTSAMPALGILDQDLAAGEEGIAITFGKAQGLNTSGLTEGATAYVSPTTPGSIVDTRPTADNHLVQNIGIVMRAHASNGAIKVTGIGRANDIPNDVSSNIASNTSAIENSAQLSDVSVELSSLVSSIHHGDLSGLEDNDHPQYTLSSVSTEKFQYLNEYTVMPQINSSYSGLTEWVEGSGSMTNDWVIYTTTMNASSNERVYAPDPFNGSSIVWKAYDDGPGDGSPFEGGFKNQLTLTGLDISKDHRLSVFIKQHDNQDGVLYFGPEQWNGTSNALFRQNTGAFDTDPYFDTYEDNPKVNEWYLWVGFINASGTPSGTDNYSDLYGIYDMSGGRDSSNFKEWTFSSTNCTTTNLRAFYFADAVDDGAVGASFWHPRIDALDGNEPSIKDLLKLFTTQHGQLDGLEDDDHTQYIIEDPTTSGRNTIIPTGDFPGLIIQATSANTGGLFTIKDDAGDDLFEVTVDGQVEIPRQTSYGVRHPNDGTFYPLVGLDSANDRVFGDLLSNTGKRVHIQQTTGDISFESNDDDIIFRNGPLNGEVLRIKSDGSLTPSGSNLLVSGGGSFTGDVDINGSSVSATMSAVDAIGAFSYMQMTSDGTAGTTELNIGRGATQTVKEDGSTNIVWDSANNEFDVNATGTYHVLANLVLSVAATATIDLKIKKNSTAQNTFAAHGVHSAEDPEEVTMQCVFDATAGDTISVTFDELGSNNVTPKSGTNIMVRRLA